VAERVEARSSMTVGRRFSEAKAATLEPARARVQNVLLVARLRVTCEERSDELKVFS